MTTPDDTHTVHLAGKVVHYHHPCTTACDFPPGWYTPDQAADIIDTLPDGKETDYHQVAAQLRNGTWKP